MTVPKQHFNHLPKTLALLVLSVLLTGCGTTGKYLQTYFGPPRERKDIAILQVDKKLFGNNAILQRIDQISLASETKRNNTQFVELLPGPHNLTMDFTKGGARSVDPIFLEFKVKAGGTYQLRAAIMPQTFGEAWAFNSGIRQANWTAWIVDLDSGKVIAGIPREAPERWFEK